MRVFVAVTLLLSSLSCNNAQVYPTQGTEDAAEVDAAVVWRYTAIMNRLLAQDFDPTALSDQQFINTYIQKTMGVVSKRLTNDVGTALKVVGISIALQGKFPADGAVGRGLKKFVDAATALGTNSDKSRHKQLSDDFSAALLALLFEDAASRQALARQGSFISTKLKGPPAIMAEIFNAEFVSEILAIEETQALQQLADIQTFFDEMVRTMHVVLNDVELMTELSDPAIFGEASTVLSKFFSLYKQLQGDRNSHDVNSIKTHVESLISSLRAQQLTGVITLSEALWVASRPVHFENLQHSAPCASPAWQAVQDLDGTSLVSNFPDEAITALQLCRLSSVSCDDWGDWSNWTPAANTTCVGETLTQTRRRQRTCPAPCDLADCSTTDLEEQDVEGTETCLVEPVCKKSCDLGCQDWHIWQSKVWSPLQDSVCGGQKMQQRRLRVQRRTCPSLCEDIDCPTFQIISPLKRTVEGTGNCPAQPEPTCDCCDDDNNEITACPRDSNLPWNSDTCTCGSCSKEAIMACGGIYSTGKLYSDRTLDNNCACYYKTSRYSWAGTIIYGNLFDTACALQNVAAFKDDNEGRRIRTTLWDEGCVTHESFIMGCVGASLKVSPVAGVREKFINFHDRTRTRQTIKGYWGLGCAQIFRDRQTFERRMMNTILKCEHALSDAAWEQIGKPPHFERLYKKTHATFLERRIPEWGMHLKICESDYQKNRPDRIKK